jgi:hypothetical protein
MPMYRTHSTSLVRNAASTPFARDSKSPRNTDPRTEFSVDYSKELKGFYRLCKRYVGWQRHQYSLRVFAHTSPSAFSTVSRLITLAAQIAASDTRTHIYALDNSPHPRGCNRPVHASREALSTPPPIAMWSFPAFSLHWIRSGTC